MLFVRPDCTAPFFFSSFHTFHRWNGHRQVDVDEHAFQHHVWERRGQPLSERRLPAAAHVRPAGEQRSAETDRRRHGRLRWPDQQRRQVRMVEKSGKTLKNLGRCLCSAMCCSQRFFFFPFHLSPESSVWFARRAPKSRFFSDSNGGSRHQLSTKFSFTLGFSLQNGNDMRWDGAGEEILDPFF